MYKQLVSSVSKYKFFIMGLVCLILIGLHFFIFNAVAQWNFTMTRRFWQFLVVILASFSIAGSTVLLQQLSQNRLITPSVLGLDSLYIFIQTALFWFFGSFFLTGLNKNFVFILILIVMLGVAYFLHELVIQKVNKNYMLLLLAGITIGILFRSATQFLQTVIDPNEYLLLQARTMVQLSNVNLNYALIALGCVFIIFVLISDKIKIFEVIGLGKDLSLNLGVSFQKYSRYIFLTVAILSSLVTALVGPMLFFGTIVLNVTLELRNNYSLKKTLFIGSFVAFMILMTTNLFVEHLFNFRISMSVVLNAIGGIYFLYLILRGVKI